MKRVYRDELARMQRSVAHAEANRLSVFANAAKEAFGWLDAEGAPDKQTLVDRLQNIATSTTLRGEHNDDEIQAALDTAFFDVAFAEDVTPRTNGAERDEHSAILPKVDQLPASPPLATVSMADLATRPAAERKWIVPGLIVDRNVNDLSGDGGIGKSKLILQLGAAMVTTTDWIGYMPTPGSVLYLSCEDELNEIHLRTEEIVAASGGRFALTDLAGLHVADLTAGETELALAENGKLQLTPLYDAVEKAIGRLRPKMCVIDTRADAFGGSEIDRRQVRSFVRALRRLCLEYDMGIVLLSHPSLAGMSSGTGQSGSTGWGNGVRVRLALERPKATDGSQPDPDLRLLVAKKSNYGPLGASVPLRFANGVFRPEKNGLAGLDRLAQDQLIEERFVQLIREFDLQGRTVNNSSGPNYAPSAFAKADGKIGSQQFRAAMERLFAAGKLSVQPFGPPSRNTRKIVEVAE